MRRREPTSARDFFPKERERRMQRISNSFIVVLCGESGDVGWNCGGEGGVVGVDGERMVRETVLWVMRCFIEDD